MTTMRYSIPFVAALAIAGPSAAQVGAGVTGPAGAVQPGEPVGITRPVPPVGVVQPVEPVGVTRPVPTAGLPRPFVAATVGPVPPTPVLAGPGAFPFAVAIEQDREIARQDREQERKDREVQRARAERDRESALYEQGTNALYEGRWDRALGYFTRLADVKGSRTDAALYWKSYSQNRLGQRAEALSTIAELTKGYPGSTYLKQARALEVEVRSAAGQKLPPQAEGDEDLKIYAINALVRSNPTEAVPLLENQLNGNASPRVKSQALFVLAQINNPKAREILKNVAKGSAIPELQGRAIQYLGVHGGAESRATLAEIYASTTDVDLKRRILRAFMVAGERERLFAAAQSETVPELRLEAVRQLGAMGANDYLWQMYQKETSTDVKRQIISAMQVGGNVARMIELAKTEKDPELRRTAVRNLGVMGSKGAGEALVGLYAAETDAAIRRTIVAALFTQGNATALVALARKEPDIAMKKDMVQKLSMMDSRVARDYMLELLK